MKNIKEITMDLLSIGLDPKKVNFFIQSKIPEIAELTVFYSNLVTVSRLQRNPTVKSEIAQKKELFGNDGESITYGLFNAQGRGQLLIGAGVPVYEGMVVGINPKDEDISVNVCKKKHLSNTRASGSDDALRLESPKIMSLEEAMEFIADDELLEVTPLNIRIRKKTLDTETRLKRKFRGLE